MNDRKLTMGDVVDLHAVVDMCLKGKRVTWAIDGDVGRLQTGVARHIVKSPDNFGFLRHDEDIRDGFVRISGTMEHTIPVMTVVEMMREGLLAVDAK